MCGLILSGTVRPDALSPALSHREREQTLKKQLALLFAFTFVRPDALTPALSHRERVQTLKTTT